MAKFGKRIYKTTDGRHVLDGDTDAAFLAFSQHDENVPASVIAEVEGNVEGKARRPASNKQAPKPGDK